jgi:hypothetical protein
VKEHALGFLVGYGLPLKETAATLGAFYEQKRGFLGYDVELTTELSDRFLSGHDPLDGLPLELRAEDASAVCLPPVFAHGASRRILRPHGEQSKWGALHYGVMVQAVREAPQEGHAEGLREPAARHVHDARPTWSTPTFSPSSRAYHEGIEHRRRWTSGIETPGPGCGRQLGHG